MPIDPRTLKGYHGPGGGKRQPCTSCGYDLAGLPADGLCPECGVGFGRMAEVAPVPSRIPATPGSARPAHSQGLGQRPAGPPASAPASSPGPSRRPAHAGGLYLEGATCPSCGYGLGGLKVGTACPECKHRTDPTESSASAAVAAMTPDLRCLACGYDLRGIARGSVCPECGTPSGGHPGQLRSGDGRSRRHNHSVLMDLPVATLVQLRLRVVGLCLAWMGWMFAWLGVWLSVLLVAWFGLGTGLVALAVGLAGVAGIVAAAAQWWAMGAKRPIGVGPLLGQPDARRVRAVLAPLVWTVLAGVILLSWRLGGGGTVGGFTVQILAYPFVIAGGVALAAVLPLHAELARLLQDDQATNRLTGLTWGLLLAAIFACFTVMIVLYLPRAPVLGLGSQIVCTIIAAIAPTLWFGSLIAIAQGFGWAISNRQSQLEREARWVARSTERGQAERLRDARAFGRDAR